jgi:pyroglutamyl-peptidase
VTRVLVYGFGPYKQFKDNVTSRIVKKLRASRALKKILFPVEFDKKQFTDAVKKHRPDVVLGLGQCSSGRRLRIERWAVNKKLNHKKEKSRPIVRGGSKRLATSLPLKKELLGRRTKTSYDAGDYVCNFSMYVILDHLECHHLAARFGFIHIPHDYDSKLAVKFVEKILRGQKRTELSS